ncbi:MAG TPA: hypothetical protein VG034_28635 [Acidimicrobiia bacterium]|jgi:hypothetical protein|nr:hypothetical protein [Acidimicrobiia bacterium]
MALTDSSCEGPLGRSAVIEVTASLAAGPVVGGLRGLLVKGATELELPQALTVGRNAKTGVDVYVGVRNGKPVYTGITNNIEGRAAQHGSRFDLLDQLTSSSVSRGEARAIEQAMIERNPLFENAINSISPRHSWYQQAVDWGEQWLTGNGF